MFFLLLCAIFVALVLLMLLWILKIEIEFKIIIKNGTNYSFMIVRMLKGLLRLRLNLSLCPDKNKLFTVTIRKTDSSREKSTTLEDALQYIKKAINAYKRNKKSFLYLKSKIKFDNLSVRSRIGTGDAAATALVSGSFYWIFSMTAYHIMTKYSLKKHKILVLPFFKGPLLDLDFDCIINFKLGDIIITGVNILVQKIKGGEKGVGTSY